VYEQNNMTGKYSACKVCSIFGTSTFILAFVLLFFVFG